MLRGRARHEKVLGVREVTLRLSKETRYRSQLKTYKNKTQVRKNIDAAAVEHGTGWSHMKNDLARQNVALLPTSQRILAQYEPLAFKSLLELCGSAIPPPPSAVEQHPNIPEAVYNAAAANAALEHKAALPTLAAEEELKVMVGRMIAKSSPALTASLSAKGSDAWLDTWKEFESIDSNKRIKM